MTRINLHHDFRIEDEFDYLGGQSITFIPYHETTPVIGGVSTNSIYYKSIERNLGYIIENEDIILSVKKNLEIEDSNIKSFKKVIKLSANESALGVSSKVKKIIVSNPRINGKGINKLRAAGIKVEVGSASNEAKELNKVFIVDENNIIQAIGSINDFIRN